MLSFKLLVLTGQKVFRFHYITGMVYIQNFVKDKPLISSRRPLTASGSCAYGTYLFHTPVQCLDRCRSQAVNSSRYIAASGDGLIMKASYVQSFICRNVKRFSSSMKSVTAIYPSLSDCLNASIKVENSSSRNMVSTVVKQNLSSFK